MKICVLSDLHLFNKTANVEKALSKSNDADLILIVGDIADRADEKQYDIFLKLIDEKSHGTHVYCVWGNLYINDGSICPTTTKDKNDKIQQGNVTLLDIGENEICVIVKGIHTDTLLFENTYEF